MKKKYNFPEVNPDDNILREPAMEYKRTTQLNPSPPLTKEELKDALTTDDVIEIWCDYIDKKFD